MITRSTTLLFMIVLAVLAIGIFLLEKQTSSLRSEIAGFNASIAKHAQSVKILQAEWAYLTNPKRLQTLANKHLTLQKLDSRQVYDIEAIPLRNRTLASYGRNNTIRAAWVAPRR